MEQKDIWKEHTSDITAEDIVKALENPAIFQSELVEYIEANLKGGGDDKRIVEVGCETAITNFLVDCESKYFLDYNADVIELDKQVQKLIYPERNLDTFTVGDMFHMPYENDFFSIAFNSGVLEHYDKDEISLALREMGRVIKPCGCIIIGLPNHYSWVYRFAYLLGMMLDSLGIRKWPYPKEYKYYDLKEEITSAGLILEERIVLSYGSIWNWWSGRKKFPLRILLKIIEKVIPSEGYLTVLKIKK